MTRSRSEGFGKMNDGENETLREDFALLINGELQPGSTSLEVINPATERVFARCPAASRRELDQCVRAARLAWRPWRQLSYAERAASVDAFADRLIAEQQPLAELLTREQGKPLDQSLAEIERGAAQSKGLIGIAIEPETLIDDAIRLIELHYRPLGVVGIITPWNAPINLALGPLVSALYTGNTVVLKPSPYTPLTTLKLGELLKNLVPPGVVNILAGGDTLGEWISEHKGIDKISFTGSVETGKKVLERAAGTLKRVTLELGGNDPAIILDDVDPEAIAKKLFFAAFVNSGQVCMAIKRIYAHEAIYDALCAALVREAEQARVGDGFAPGTQLGPLQNRAQYEKVVALLAETRETGARILAGGDVPQRPGYFITPTLVADVDDDSRLVRDEQFGPIVPILKFRSVEEAVRRANDTRYGLAGSVWTNDIARGRAIAAELEVGTAWINQHRATSAYVPFGGAKESGLGRQYSILGLKGYMEPTVLSIAK